MVDILDLGCESAEDVTEEDDGVSSALSISLEGLFDRGNGTFDAYFSYNNPGKKSVVIVLGETANTKNVFKPGEPNRGQPVEFKPGEHRGAVRVPFIGEPITWTLKTSQGVEQSVVVSAESPRLKPVEPLASCINMTESGGISAVMGYSNPNLFDITLPVGALNSFSPGDADRSQPTVFFSGRNAGVFSLPVDTELTWKLATSTAVVSPSTKVCECPAAKNSAPKVLVNKSATALGEMIFGATEMVERASGSRLAGATDREKKRIQESFDRARRKAADQVLDVQGAVKKLPDESRSCAEPPVGCRIVDDGPTIELAKNRLTDAVEMITRIIRRVNYLQTGGTTGNEKFIDKAQAEYDKGMQALDQVPRFRTACQ